MKEKKDLKIVTITREGPEEKDQSRASQLKIKETDFKEKKGSKIKLRKKNS